MAITSTASRSADAAPRVRILENARRQLIGELKDALVVCISIIEADSSAQSTESSSLTRPLRRTEVRKAQKRDASRECVAFLQLALCLHMYVVILYVRNDER